MTKVLLLYTGGTIGMARDYKTNSLIPFDFNNLKKNIPELNQIEAKIDYISFNEPLDSSNIQPKHWVQIVEILEENYSKYDGFVVLHGTDTMAYTASAVSFMFRGIQKPIVFTGSQLPVGDLRTDAKENLITSLHFASLKNGNEMAVQEVCLYFEYKLFRANRTTKINAENFDAFASPNYPHLGQSGVHLEVEDKFLFESKEKELVIEKGVCADVGLLKIFPGISRAMVESVFKTESLKALIIEAFGSGNVFTEDWFLNLIETKVKDDVKVIIKTQCAGGLVELGRYETSSALKEMNAISGKDLTTEAAVTKAICLLSKNLSYDLFKQQFEQNLVGEMI